MSKPLNTLLRLDRLRVASRNLKEMAASLESLDQCEWNQPDGPAFNLADTYSKRAASNLRDQAEAIDRHIAEIETRRKS